MAKKNRPLKDLGREHVKAQLLRTFPFLKNKYREIKKEEVDSEEVFAELFGKDVKFEKYKLTALYEFQK